MDFLEHADASLREERKRTVEQPTHIDPRIAPLIERQINEEYQRSDKKELREAEVLAEEDSRKRRNQHGRGREQQRNVHRSVRERLHFAVITQRCNDAEEDAHPDREDRKAAAEGDKSEQDTAHREGQDVEAVEMI